MSRQNPVARSRATGAWEAEPNRWREVVGQSARLFYERGYESTSITDIATALAITKGSLYHYVSSKEDLLYAIIAEVHSRTTAHLRQLTGEGDALTRLWSYFVGHVRLNVDQLHASTLVYRDLRHLGADRRRDIVEIRDELQTYVRGLLTEGIEQGLVRGDTDVALTSIQMFSVANGIYQWYQPEGDRTGDEVARSVATFAVRGVAAIPWDPPQG